VPAAGGEDHGLGDRQLAQIRDAEVALGGGGDAVALVAVEVQVQVVGDDRLLAFLTRELLGELDRLDDLLDLAVDRAGGRRQKALFDELLGDGGGASRASGDGVSERRQDRRGIEAGVGPEGLVLCRRGRVEDDVGIS
jgi:hypothetical protein